ncbi:MAG: phospholipid carrier-dependent glycosyltransferase [Geobacteraceae bacterium]|nr:phospholipid carrier-dependent glycosyltransferase [Geobacteraceae bacterium]
MTGNEAVRGLSFPHLKSAFTSFYVGNYAPLHIVSYMLDYMLWGMNPKGYLITNIIIHSCNGYLAYRLFFRLDGRQAVAFLAALIFVLHPVQVESVAWVTERKTLLAMFFSLLTLHAYVSCKYAESGARRRWFLVALIACIAALLSKAVAVVVPLIIVAYDWYDDGQKWEWKEYVNKIPFFLAAIALSVITVVSQRSADSVLPYLSNSPINNVMTMMSVFCRYLGIIFWPTDLAPIYKPPIKTALDMEVLISFMVLAFILITGIYLLHRRKLAGFALTVFLLGLLPVSHIFPLPTLMQDRYLYFPLLGFSLCIVVAITDLAKRQFGENSFKFVMAAFLICSVLLSYNSYKQAGIWRNSETLWAHTVKVVPQSKQAWIMLSTTRHELKDLAGAEDSYLHLLAIAPKDNTGLNGIGTLYGEKGEMEKSLFYLRKAVEVYPNDSGSLVNLGYAAFLHGELKEAMDSFNHALAINPELSTKLLPVINEIASRRGNKP